MGNKTSLLLLILLLLLRLSLYCTHSTQSLLVFISIINILSQDDHICVTFIILVYYHFHIMVIAIVIIANVILVFLLLTFNQIYKYFDQNSF